MTNEELEFFIEKYISVRVKVGKPEYDSKLVRQVMMSAAFYVREEQRKIDTNNACEAYCNSVCNAEKPCDNKCGGYNRFVRELEGKV